MNNINLNILDSFDVYNKVIPRLDRTITIYGNVKFRDLFKILYYGKHPLMRRNKLLKTIIYNPLRTKRITSALKKIKKLQDSISWLFAQDHKEISNMYMNKFFNTKDLLRSTNFMKTYLPLIMMIIYIAIYIALVCKGKGINTLEYVKTLYMGYKTQISNMLKSLIGNENIVSFMVNILAKLYLFYQFYTFFSMCNTSITYYKKRKTLYKKINDIRKVIDYIQYIYKKDIFLKQEKLLIKPHIDFINRKFKQSKLNNMGYILLLIKNKSQYDKQFNNILEYIGLLDSFISITRLLNEGYTLPEFIFDNTPYISISGWDPYHRFNYTPFTITKSESITPEKLVHYKNIMLTIILSQTLGISNMNIKYTPFANIYFNQINDIIPDQYFYALVNKSVDIKQLSENTRNGISIDY